MVGVNGYQCFNKLIGQANIKIKIMQIKQFRLRNLVSDIFLWLFYETVDFTIFFIENTNTIFTWFFYLNYIAIFAYYTVSINLIWKLFLN